MRERMRQLAESKKQVAINFAAAAGGKLVSISGIVVEVTDDHMIVNDIYGNHMIVPYVSIAFIEVKK